MVKLKGKCRKPGSIAERIAGEIFARRVAKLGEETDKLILRVLSKEATLVDLATVRRAAECAEFMARQAEAS